MDSDGLDLDALQRLLADAETAAAQLAALTVEVERLRARLDTERRLRESAERTSAVLRAALDEHLAEERRADEPDRSAGVVAQSTPRRRRYVSVRPRETI